MLLAGFIAMGFMLRRTILGRSLYATGGNAAAALVADIRVQRIKIIAFTLSGFISGVAGWLLAAWQMAITSNQGDGLPALRHCGADHRRSQRFRGTRRHARHPRRRLLLTVIHVGLAIVYVPSFYVSMIGGILIFIAVAIDALRVNALGDA